MENKRLAALEQMLEASPQDSFVRYGLAQELVKADRFEEAVAQFERILEADPDYQAAYYHAGKALEKLGRNDEARSVYERGVATSHRTGDLHARSELEAALSELG